MKMSKKEDKWKTIKISKKLDKQLNELTTNALLMAFMYPLMKVLGYIEVENNKEPKKKEG